MIFYRFDDLYFQLHNPPYSSSLHFELYKLEDEFFLQVSYRNATNEIDIEFPICGTKCSIEDLRQIYKDTIPTSEYDEECQLPIYYRAVTGNICGTGNCEQFHIFKTNIVYAILERH